MNIHVSCRNPSQYCAEFEKVKSSNSLYPAKSKKKIWLCHVRVTNINKIFVNKFIKCYRDELDLI